MKTKAMRIGLMKVLTALMAVPMMIGLAGCGAEGPSRPDGTGVLLDGTWTRPTESTQDEKVDEWTEEENWTEEEEFETEDESWAEEELDENEGIGPGIVACINVRSFPNVKYTVFLVNPESGDYTEINSFSFKHTDDALLNDTYSLYYGNKGSTFSHDLSKMAVSYTIKSTDRQHAGWIDNTGRFLDVIETAGMDVENDFVDRPNYCSVGFTKDGYFVFIELESKYNIDGKNLRKYGKPYYVAVDDPSVAYEGNPLIEEAYKGYDIDFHVTDWLNDDELLYGDRGDENFVIRSASGKHEDMELVPGDMRLNYNAIASPDGSTIAFLSSPKTNIADATIYIVSNDGSNIQKIFDYSVFAGPDGNFANTEGIWSYILWWE